MNDAVRDYDRQWQAFDRHRTEALRRLDLIRQRIDQPCDHPDRGHVGTLEYINDLLASGGALRPDRGVHRKMKKLLIVAAVSLCAATSAQAQQAPDPYADSYAKLKLEAAKQDRVEFLTAVKNVYFAAKLQSHYRP